MLRLSTQQHENPYFSKFALLSKAKDSRAVLVRDSEALQNQIGLCIALDNVFVKKAPMTNWDVLCVLIGESYYYVMPNEFKPIEKDENE